MTTYFKNPLGSVYFLFMILSIRYSEKEKREIFIDDSNRIYLWTKKNKTKQNNKTVAKNRKNWISPFRDIKHILRLLESEECCTAYSRRVLNYPLIVRKVVNVQNILDIDTVSVPNKFSNTCRLIQDNFQLVV